jgi:hypothetical protein
MTCLTELTCAVYADGELSPGEARAAEQHLAGCARCRALVAAFRDESRVLAAALEEPAAIASLGAAPATSRATTNGRRVLGWGLGIGALAGLAVLAERLAGLSIGSAGPADWIGVAVDIALFVATNAAGLERGLTAVAILSMAGMALAGWLYLGRVPSRAVAMIALPLGVALGTGPSPSEALETRSGRIVTVGAGEKLGGTLVAAGWRAARTWPAARSRSSRRARSEATSPSPPGTWRCAVTWSATSPRWPTRRRSAAGSGGTSGFAARGSSCGRQRAWAAPFAPTSPSPPT